MLPTAATALDAKLATFGGATGRGGRGGGFGGGGRGGAAARAGGPTPFIALNNTFDTLVDLNHNGIDMAPTKAQLDTWTNVCQEYKATVAAWKTMLSVDVAGFNGELTKNGAQAISAKPSALTAPASCAFAPPAAGQGRGGEAPERR